MKKEEIIKQLENILKELYCYLNINEVRKYYDPVIKIAIETIKENIKD